jgi:hypothetical protein
VAYRTLDEIDGLIKVLNSLSNNEDKTESRRYSRNENQYLIYKSDVLNEYNNANLDVLEDRITKYIEDYGDDFSTITTENFGILKQDVINQRVDNTNYTSSKAALNLVSDEGEALFRELHGIDEADSLNIKSGNKTVVYLKPNISDTKKYPVDINTNAILESSQKQYDIDVVNYNKAKKLKKERIAKEMQANLESYIEEREKFKNQYTERLTSPSEIEFFNKLDVTDNILSFGVEELADNYHISKHGADAYFKALTTGDMTGISNNIVAEVRHDTAGAEEMVNDYKARIDEYNEKKYIVSNYDNWLLEGGDQITGEETLYIGADDTKISYNDVAADQELHEMVLVNWQTDIETLQAKLEKIDARYQNNPMSGGSLTELFPFEDPIITTKTTTPVSTTITPVSSTTYIGDKLVLQDVNEVKSKIEARRGSGLTSDQNKLTERLVGDMNDISLKLDAEKKLIKPFFDDYDKAMEEYATLEGLLADYKEVGMAGLFTIDDPEADEIQRRMNAIERIWMTSATRSVQAFEYIKQYETANPDLYKYIAKLSVGQSLKSLKSQIESGHEKLDKNYKAKSNILEKIK